MTSLALASIAAATTRPSATLASSSPAREELSSPPQVAFLVSLFGRGEITNYSCPPLELSSEAISP
jgi:hypothetical protein